MNQLIKLLQLEWLKFSNNIVVRLVIPVFSVLFPIIILLSRKVLADAPPPVPSSITFLEFPLVWDYQGYVGNWMVSILLGFLVIYLFTSEVSYKTMRQNVLTGLTRKQYFTSKIITVVVLSLYASIIYVISSVIIGLAFTDVYDFELIVDNNFATFRFFLMSLGYLSFALLLANLIRRGILAILVYLFYMMAVEVLARLFVMYKLKTRLASFAPMNAIEDLMPNPFFRLPEMALFKEIGFNVLLSYQEAICATVVYSSLFVWLGWIVFKRKDL